MAEPSLISICIPAYKHPDFLKRLLDSISIQSFKNFEVIISDDLIRAVLVGGYPEMLRRRDQKRRRAWARDYINAIVERDI